MIECHLNVPQGRRWPEWRGHTEFNANQVAVTPGLRKANVRVEQRLDGSMAVRHGEGVLAPLRPPPPDISKRHQLPDGHMVRCRAVLGGLHHEYWLEKGLRDNGTKFSRTTAGIPRASMLRSDSVNLVDEPHLPDHITLREPADLTLSDHLHRLNIAVA
jgi:hypothetical protein